MPRFDGDDLAVLVRYGFLESFHGKLRDELLDREVFVSVAEAQTRLETHQRWYNEGHPHSSLHYVSPAAFARS